MNPRKKKSARSSIILISLVGAAVFLVLLLLPFIFPMTGKPGPNWVAALGRFHILTLHFPIAFVLLVPLLEGLTRTRPLQNLKVAIYPLLMLATLSSITASLLGFMLVKGGGFSGKLVADHMWGGIITSILLVITLLLKEILRKKSGTPFQAAYFITLGYCLLSLVSTSHHGASLVHGEDFLVEKLPPGLQSPFGATAPAPGAITEESNAYEHLIEPIFRTHCLECHGAGKSKGGYRMDDFQLLLAGGDGGIEGISPGNLEDSEVHYRISLPPTSKAFMPPTGNLPLTKEQIALIAWWIESGASAEASIVDLLQAHPSELVADQLDRFSAN